MMAWFELLDQTNSFERDKNNNASLVRTFRVTGVPPDLIQESPGAVLQNGVSGPGLPEYNTIYSLTTPAVLEAYQTQNDNGTVIARALYSTSRRWRLSTTPDDLDPGYGFLDERPIDATEEIPYFEPVPEAIDSPTGPVVVVSWRERILTVRQNATIITFRRNVQALTSSQKNAIQGQRGKVHLVSIDGMYSHYRYEAGPRIDQGNGRVLIEHTWFHEPGIPASFANGFPSVTPIPTLANTVTFPRPTLSPGLDGAYEPLGVNIFNGLVWLRQPLHKLIYGFRKNIAGHVSPYYSIVPDGDFSDLNGWQTLPGL